MNQGYVHSFHTAAAADGPGVRFAIFLSGCPFRCKYCHNPDTWEMKRGTLKTVDSLLDEIKKYYKIFPSVETVTTRKGISFPERSRARRAACSMPEQQGTSMRRTQRLAMRFSERIAQSFSV